jgi:hypothetical protein
VERHTRVAHRRLGLGVLRLRALVDEHGQRDRGKDPDDQDDHHQLDQREAAVVPQPVQSTPCHSLING